MNPWEFSGRIISLPLGVAAFIISYLRAARTFHPKGILVSGSVVTSEGSPVSFHPYAILRFSGAIWKRHEHLPDTLGIAIRFCQDERPSVHPQEGDQDLLFASFKTPLQTLISPFLTKSERFQKNEFYSISPFAYKREICFFKLTCEGFSEGLPERSDNLRENVKENNRVKLWWKTKKTSWAPIAEVTLIQELDLDQEDFCFNPFQSGLKIIPVGFIHHLRYAVYPLGQFGRRLRKKMSSRKKTKEHRETNLAVKANLQGGFNASFRNHAQRDQRRQYQ